MPIWLNFGLGEDIWLGAVLSFRQLALAQLTVSVAETKLSNLRFSIKK